MTALLACLAILTSKPAEKPLYRFVAYGDSRTHSAADTDISIQAEVVSGAVQAKPDFILQTGDLVQDGSNAKQWALFDEFMKPIWKAHVPYYPAQGNHDAAGTSAYLAYMKKRIVPTWGGVPRTKSLLNYSFDRAPLRFVAVDTEASTKPGSPQYQWIERTLSDARQHGLSPAVFLHRCMYSIGAYAKDTSRREDLARLFERYRVAVVFQGHDHNYYRTRRRGSVYMITGGAGAPLYDQNPDRGQRLDPADPADPAWPDVWAKAHHYITCDVYANRIDVRVDAIRFPKPNPIDKFSIPLD